MDKAISKLVGKTMGAGEKIAPVKSIKLKVKFHKPGKGKLNKAAEKMLSGGKYSK